MSDAPPDVRVFTGSGSRPGRGGASPEQHVWLRIGNQATFASNPERACDALGELTISGGRSDRFGGAPDGAVAAFTLHIDPVDTPAVGDVVSIAAGIPGDPTGPKLDVFYGVITDMTTQHVYGSSRVFVQCNAADGMNIAANTAVTLPANASVTYQEVSDAVTELAAAFNAIYNGTQYKNVCHAQTPVPNRTTGGYLPVRTEPQTRTMLEWMRRIGAGSYNLPVMRIAGSRANLVFTDPLKPFAGQESVGCEVLTADPGVVKHQSSDDYANVITARYRQYDTLRKEMTDHDFTVHKPVPTARPDRLFAFETEQFSNSSRTQPVWDGLNDTVTLMAQVFAVVVPTYTATAVITETTLERFTDPHHAETRRAAASAIASCVLGMGYAPHWISLALDGPASMEYYVVEGKRLIWQPDGWHVEYTVTDKHGYAQSDRPTRKPWPAPV